MSRLVRLVANVDYKKLPLSPVEGGVFARIDGKTNEDELARVTGFHKDTVAKALDKLLALGAVESVEQAKTREAADRDAKAVATMALGGIDPNAPPVYNPRELDEDVDLDVGKKKQILDGFYRLDSLNYYDLLGVHQLVDKKQIKAAYYQVAPEYHPDKFFRKNLGSFKPKIEAIFARLTLAHDVLSSKQRRAEYDEYLASAPPPAPARGGSMPPAARPAAGPARAPGGVAPDEAKRQALLAERRRALAAKLGGGRVASAAPPPLEQRPAPPGPAVDPRQAAEALRVRYEAARQESERGQLRKYLETGRDALQNKDFHGASNAYRLAVSLAPNDAEVQREAAEAQQACAVALAETFAKQGEGEAHQERWGEAAASFSKACQGRPNDARLHDRAAHTTYKSGANPRRAVELARRAVELAPKVPMYRVTLAYAYIAAGFDTSSNAELDRALELAAGDERVKPAVAAAREALKAALQAPRRDETREGAPVSGRAAAPLVAGGSSPVVPSPGAPGAQTTASAAPMQAAPMQGAPMQGAPAPTYAMAPQAVRPFVPQQQPGPQQAHSGPPYAAPQPYPVTAPAQPYPAPAPAQPYPLGAAAMASMPAQPQRPSGQYPASPAQGSQPDMRGVRPGAYSVSEPRVERVSVAPRPGGPVTASGHPPAQAATFGPPPHPGGQAYSAPHPGPPHPGSPHAGASHGGGGYPAPPSASWQAPGLPPIPPPGGLPAFGPPAAAATPPNFDPRHQVPGPPVDAGEFPGLPPPPPGRQPSMPGFGPPPVAHPAGQPHPPPGQYPQAQPHGQPFPQPYPNGTNQGPPPGGFDPSGGRGGRR